MPREEYVGQWLPEPVVTGPGSDPFAAYRIDESLSMAFLVLLERLKPLERAVFLLREVFDYDYPEIAGVLGRSEVNCRQVLHRARLHVAEVRPRFQVSAGLRDELFRRFLQAIGAGYIDGLLALLSGDIVLHSDGGGRGPAVPNVLRGRDHVARGILAGMKIIPQTLSRRLAQINGQSGILQPRPPR